MANKTEEALKKGQFEQATQLWDEAETLIEQVREGERAGEKWGGRMEGDGEKGRRKKKVIGWRESEREGEGERRWEEGDRGRGWEDEREGGIGLEGEGGRGWEDGGRGREREEEGGRMKEREEDGGRMEKEEEGGMMEREE